MTTPNEEFLKQSSPNNVMPIFYLWRAVCRWFYDEEHCPFGFRSEIEKEIINWNKIIQYQKKIRYERFGPNWQNKNPVGQKGNIIDEMEYQIGRMCQWIVYSETGTWNSPEGPPIKADTLRTHRIDYRMTVDCRKWFPEMEDKDGFKKAKAYLKQAMEDHPTDYVNTEKKKG